jgi:death on curing protein
MPKARSNGKDLYPTIFDKTAAYLFHLIQNPPFVDGNKRTASMISMVFLLRIIKKILLFLTRGIKKSF